jgi:hypothetical protein
LRDIPDRGRYIEQVVDESWVGHLRRFDRRTAADVALRELPFHVGENPSKVTRCVMETTVR